MERDRAYKGLTWLIEDIKSSKTVKKYVKFRYADITTIIATTLLALGMLWLGLYLLL